MTVQEWQIRRQRALDLLDLHISVLSGYARLHGMSESAIEAAIAEGRARAGSGDPDAG